jgi:hypothetical protein
MVFKNTITAYPVLLITSIKKNFEALGRTVKKTGKTIARWLKPAHKYYEELFNISLREFANKKELILIFDETLIRKIYSQLIEGSDRFYDTQLFRKITAFKLLVAMLTDGVKAFPLIATFLFSKELIPNPKETKFEWMQKVILTTQKKYPQTRIIVAADGAFASRTFLQWCVQNNIAIELRMRSNCVVNYKDERIKLKNIKDLQPKGRQMARTIQVIWHDIPLFITAQKRIDKKGEISIVFQVSTFEAKPMRHVEIYQSRWSIEKMFRTVKQNLGLQECMARKKEHQENHVASVFLAYAFLHCEQIQQKFATPEAALRAAERKKGKDLIRYIERLDRFISAAYV